MWDKNVRPFKMSLFFWSFFRYQKQTRMKKLKLIEHFSNNRDRLDVLCL